MQSISTLSPTLAVRQDVFKPEMAEQSVLCLEIGKDGLRFALIDNQRQCYWLEEYRFSSLLADRPLSEALPGICEEHPVLSAGNWQQIRVAVNSPAFTLVPDALFRKEYMSSYLALMRGNDLPAHQYAHAYHHADESFWSVFNIDHQLSDYISGLYPMQNLTFLHQTSTLVRASALTEKALISTQNLTLYFEDEFVTLIFRSNRKLLYCNRFGYKTPRDLIYYVLYVIDELRLEPYSVNAFLYGQITPYADTYTALTEFLPHLHFGTTPPNLTFSPDFDDLPEHRFLSLYGLGLL
jgi:Protein of unknown function (DUF3822)